MEMTNQNDEENKFKCLLEYFVSHLEYAETENQNSRGFEEYIRPIDEFTRNTKGEKNYNKVQNQINNWSKYSLGDISITVSGATSRRYMGDACFLNWKHSRVNIVAEWDKEAEKITDLSIAINEVKKKGTESIRKKTLKIEELGLFNKGPVNKSFKEFFEEYKNCYQEYKKAKENEQMENIKTLLINNHNIILHGAPGTGKTYLAKQIAKDLIFTKEEHDLIDKKESDIAEADKPKHKELKELFNKRCGFVQFHQSYDYTDFVEGLRPVKNGTDIGFELRPGVFKEFCKEALEKMNESVTVSIAGESREIKMPFVFIIDEINRGEMSKIFGELFYSSDPGYRVKDEDLENGKIPFAIQTQYSNLQEKPNKFDEKLKIENKEENKGKYGHFFVPENVYIIGTMNDIDRSVESMDFAMRRRFAFEEISADNRVDMLEELEDKQLIADAKNKMKELNEGIEKIDGLTSAYHIGPAYFLKLKNYKGDFDLLWEYHIEGVVMEYLRGMDNAEKSLIELKKAYFGAKSVDENHNN